MEAINVANLVLGIVGAAFGLAGTIMSGIALWRLFDRDKVKLRVRASRMTGVGALAGMRTMAIDVLNLSTFPIVVTEIGFFHHGTDKKSVVLMPPLMDGTTLPKKLEPRTDLTAMIDPNELAKMNWDTVECVFARTVCGVIGRGKV